MGQYALPLPNTQRWVVRRKAEVIAAIREGDLSIDEACRRYALTADELISWQVAFGRHGLEGLCAMKTQLYRRSQTGRAGNAPTP